MDEQILKYVLLCIFRNMYHFSDLSLFSSTFLSSFSAEMERKK